MSLMRMASFTASKMERKRSPLSCNSFVALVEQLHHRLDRRADALELLRESGAERDACAGALPLTATAYFRSPVSGRTTARQRTRSDDEDQQQIDADDHRRSSKTARAAARPRRTSASRECARCRSARRRRGCCDLRKSSPPGRTYAVRRHEMPFPIARHRVRLSRRRSTTTAFDLGCAVEAFEDLVDLRAIDVPDRQRQADRELIGCDVDAAQRAAPYCRSRSGDDSSTSPNAPSSSVVTVTSVVATITATVERGAGLHFHLYVADRTRAACRRTAFPVRGTDWRCGRSGGSSAAAARSCVAGIGRRSGHTCRRRSSSASLLPRARPGAAPRRSSGTRSTSAAGNKE